MVNIEDVKYGWDYMAKLIGADMGGQNARIDFADNVAQNNAINAQNVHIQQINDAIDQLAENINTHPHLNLGVEQFKGYVAEEMHAGTFNIEAIKQGSEHRAWTLQENGYGSVDIKTNFGKDYSLKYSNTAKDAESMQAALNTDTRAPKYQDQELLIASKQLKDAQDWAHKRNLKNLETRPDVAESHKYSEDHLTDRITDDNGISSKKLTIKESKQIAKEAKKDGVNLEKHGYTKESLIDEVQIDYLDKALKAGLTAAAITAILDIVPELYKAIDYLIKNGQIDVNGLKKSGAKIITDSGEAFLRGSLAYGVEMAIQHGLLGEALKSVNPSIVGAAVTIIFGTIKDSIYVAAGKMTAKEMGVHFVDSLVVSSGYLVSMKIGGAIAQALFPEVPGVAYAIGSLLGCSFAAVYNIGKRKLISFCVDTGFTCFGLVDQDYELPEEVLAEMGVHPIPVPRTEVSRTEIASTQVEAQVNRTGYETIDITVLKRGIIGVNRVGYVPE